MPLTTTLPSLGTDSPLISRAKVVLPEPLRPITPKRVPSTRTDSLSSAVRAPYLTEQSLNSTIKLFDHFELEERFRAVGEQHRTALLQS
jgi:hypothetical protein